MVSGRFCMLQEEFVQGELSPAVFSLEQYVEEGPALEALMNRRLRNSIIAHRG